MTNILGQLVKLVNNMSPPGVKFESVVVNKWIFITNKHYGDNSVP